MSVARPCHPLLQSAVVACVGNPGSIWGDVRSLRACMVLHCITHTHSSTEDRQTVPAGEPRTVPLYTAYRKYALAAHPARPSERDVHGHSDPGDPSRYLSNTSPNQRFACRRATRDLTHGVMLLCHPRAALCFRPRHAQATSQPLRAIAQLRRRRLVCGDVNDTKAGLHRKPS